MVLRFRYPLQKIVDLKGSEKSMAEWEYAASLGRLRSEEEQLDQLRQERGAYEKELSERSSRPTALAELHLLQDYISFLDDRIRQQRQGVRAAEEHVQQRQVFLTDKMVDEKVWQNARSKSLQKYRQEALIREQNELDEIALRRASARR
ncbi:flagellar export protein FliJ [Cohnella hashimotonis]|uniref:Flagellar FliJ protein n=1 Tax=Cohnella hashimotonis TaxID=2826895 RepID=A0ABT6THM4_9BACL|nr:flagellar export protein FliJ [Cohnella hashimotonis]MDI4646220.1 flagellar export protein FliJ [Cohnella hashimotonis]